MITPLSSCSNDDAALPLSTPTSELFGGKEYGYFIWRSAAVILPSCNVNEIPLSPDVLSPGDGLIGDT